MKYIFLLLLCGCARTQILVKPSQWELRRTGFLQKLEIVEVKIATNGTVTIKGYKNDGGNEAAAAITEAAVKGAVKGLKEP